MTSSGPQTRYRLSQWLGPQQAMHLSNKVPVLRPLPNLDPVLRIRRYNMDRLIRMDHFNAGKGILDDISLLKTLLNSPDSNMTIGFDPSVLPGTSKENEQIRKDFYNGVIERAHQNGIQLLIGFAHASNNGKTNASRAFESWLENPPSTRTIDKVAEDIVNFMDQHLPAADGISFDIESVGSHGELTTAQEITRHEVLTRNFAEFYRTLALKLEPSNRIVTFAPAAFVADDLTSRTFHVDEDKRIKKDESGKPMVISTLKGAPSFYVQNFKIAAGHPNIIVRPMVYDNFSRGDDVKQFLQNWQRDVIDYALRSQCKGGAGLTAKQFQLGIKTFEGPGQKRAVKPMDGVMLRDEDLASTCRDICMTKKVGVILFASAPQKFTVCNNALNPFVPNAGLSANFPAQVPIGSRKSLLTAPSSNASNTTLPSSSPQTSSPSPTSVPVVNTTTQVNLVE